MNRLRKIVMLVSALAVIIQTHGMTQENQKRYIYLWDVTLSMVGKAPRPDGNGKTDNIYDDVVNSFVDLINGLPAGTNREIIVCPFQEEIIDVWMAKSTNSGKTEIINKIKSFTIPMHNWTNIVGPLRQINDQYVDSAYEEIIIYLLTDGIQDGPYANRENDFESYLDGKEWERNKYITRLKIVRLTDLAPKILRKDNIEIIEPGETFVDIIPNRQLSFNIIDAAKNNNPKELEIYFSANPENVKIPNGTKVRVQSQKNHFIHVDEIVEIKDGKALLALKYDYNTLKMMFNGRENIELYYRMDNVKIDNCVVSLESPNSILELVNIPEKSLKIKLRK